MIPTSPLYLEFTESFRLRPKIYNLYLFTFVFKEALLSYLEIVQTGVRGIVTDEKGEPLANASIEISGIYYTEKKKNITFTHLQVLACAQFSSMLQVAWDE